MKLYNCDCMEYMRGCKDKAFDLAIVDPPYGLPDWNNRGVHKISPCKNKIKKWDIKPDKKYFEELFRVSKHQIIWGANNFIENLKNTKTLIVWDKKIRGMHFSDCEIAWGNTYKNACRIFTNTVDTSNRIHPCQKPVELYRWLLSNYAKPGWKIFDSHLGSGSIACACHDLGFDLTGCELDKDYFQAMEKRLKKYKQQGRLF